jgi:hypothetical protein
MPSRGSKKDLTEEGIGDAPPGRSEVACRLALLVDDDTAGDAPMIWLAIVSACDSSARTLPETLEGTNEGIVSG